MTTGQRQLGMSGAATITAIALQSGSAGNCIYIETETTALLIDAGISATLLRERLAEHGRDPSRISAILISHDHGDHVRHVGVVQRKLKVPVYITEGSLGAARRRFALGAMGDIECFRPGAQLRVGSLTIETVPTPHDGTQGVAFVVGHRGRRLGVLTDLGHCFDGLGEVIGGLDGVFLESNYDPAMLREGGYPAHLKRRIQGPRGHLSNLEAAELIARHAGGGLRWACLSHLSGQNNDPTLALRTHRSILGDEIPLHVAPRDCSAQPLKV